MLTINVIPLTIDSTLAELDKSMFEALNNSAEQLAENLKDRFKDVVMTDRKAVITIQVDREKGLLIDRQYQML